MDYKYKYLKYKMKYVNLKNQEGGDITLYKTLFNSYFGNEWILTGSEAIKLYLNHFNRHDLLTFTPKDIDIIYIAKEFTLPKVGDFSRMQSSPQRSMTFKYQDKLFDVSLQDSSYYYEIDGIKVITPSELFQIYTENQFTTDSEEKKEETRKKLFALSEMKRQLKDIPTKKLQINKKISYTSRFCEENHDGARPLKRKSLFDDEPL